MSLHSIGFAQAAQNVVES